MNSNNIDGFNNNKEQIFDDDIEKGEENIFLPIEVEKYLNVTNNNIIYIYRVILNGEI